MQAQVKFAVKNTIYNSRDALEPAPFIDLRDVPDEPVYTYISKKNLKHSQKSKHSKHSKQMVYNKEKKIYECPYCDSTQSISQVLINGIQATEKNIEKIGLDLCKTYPEFNENYDKYCKILNRLRYNKDSIKDISPNEAEKIFRNISIYGKNLTYILENIVKQHLMIQKN